MKLKIELPTNPKGTAQQKGERVIGSRIQHFEKSVVSTQRRIYELAIKKALMKKKLEPPKYEGPVSLNVTFNFQIKDKKRWGYWKTSKPDLDNAIKLFQDVLASMGFFEDDSQVAALHIRKILSPEPSIFLHIFPLGEENIYSPEDSHE